MIKLLKAIIVEKKDNLFKIRIPFKHGIEGSKDSDINEELPFATLSTINVFKDTFNEGDVVYIYYENNDESKPVIMGHLYTQNSENVGSLKLRDLDISLSAKLPSNTNIGVVKSKEIGYLKGVKQPIQNQLDNILATNYDFTTEYFVDEYHNLDKWRLGDRGIILKSSFLNNDNSINDTFEYSKDPIASKRLRMNWLGSNVVMNDYAKLQSGLYARNFWTVDENGTPEYTWRPTVQSYIKKDTELGQIVDDVENTDNAQNYQGDYTPYYLQLNPEGGDVVIGRGNNGVTIYDNDKESVGKLIVPNNGIRLRNKKDNSDIWLSNENNRLYTYELGTVSNLRTPLNSGGNTVFVYRNFKITDPNQVDIPTYNNRFKLGNDVYRIEWDSENFSTNKRMGYVVREADKVRYEITRANNSNGWGFCLDLPINPIIEPENQEGSIAPMAVAPLEYHTIELLSYISPFIPYTSYDYNYINPRLMTVEGLFKTHKVGDSYEQVFSGTLNFKVLFNLDLTLMFGTLVSGGYTEELVDGLPYNGELYNIYRAGEVYRIIYNKTLSNGVVLYPNSFGEMEHVFIRDNLFVLHDIHTYKIVPNVNNTNIDLTMVYTMPMSAERSMQLGSILKQRNGLTTPEVFSLDLSTRLKAQSSIWDIHFNFSILPTYDIERDYIGFNVANLGNTVTITRDDYRVIMEQLGTDESPIVMDIYTAEMFGLTDDASNITYYYTIDWENELVSEQNQTTMETKNYALLKEYAYTGYYRGYFYPMMGAFKISITKHLGRSTTSLKNSEGEPASVNFNISYDGVLNEKVTESNIITQGTDEL